MVPHYLPERHTYTHIQKHTHTQVLVLIYAGQFWTAAMNAVHLSSVFCLAQLQPTSGPVIAHSRSSYSPLPARLQPTSGPVTAHFRSSYSPLPAQLQPTPGPVSAHSRSGYNPLPEPLLAQSGPGPTNTHSHPQPQASSPVSQTRLPATSAYRRSQTVRVHRAAHRSAAPIRYKLHPRNVPQVKPASLSYRTRTEHRVRGS